MAVQSINHFKDNALSETSSQYEGSAIDGMSAATKIAGSSFEYEIHTDFSTCDAAWRAFESDAIATPFQSLGWLKCWWDNFCIVEPDHSFELNIVFVRSHGELVLILPLIVEKYQGVRRLSWLCGHLNDYNAPLICSKFLPSLNLTMIDMLWTGIVAEISDVDILFLPKQPKHIGSHANPFYHYHAYDYRLQYHAARILGDWQSYYTERRKGKSRSRLTSKKNRLCEIANVSITEVTNVDERSKIVFQTIDWKRAQVRDSGAIDPFSDAETKPFFDNVARHGGLQDRFRVFAVYADGEPIAAAFGLNTEKGFILYQTAYTVDKYSKHSPGVLLLMHMMEIMAGEGRDYFDFSIGDEPYKFIWADCHESLMITLKPFSFKGRVAKALFIAKLSLKHWVKSSDKRFDIVKSLNRTLRNILRR